MSTLTHDGALPGAKTTLDVAGTPGIPFARLVRVELRKLVDTRAGRWLLIAMALLTVAAMVIVLLIALGQESDAAYLDFSGVASTPMGVLLPVLGVMSVTSEWGQRTHMVTFTLEPHRQRIVLAKLVAGVVVALAAVAVGFGLGAVCNVLFGLLADGDAVWNVGIHELVSFTILQVVGLLTGFAFGMLIINTAAAIVLYFVYSFVLPGVFAVLSSVSSWFEDLRPWVDFNIAQAPLLTGDLGAVDWPQFAVSGAVWFLLPLLLGSWRLLRAEVK